MYIKNFCVISFCVVLAACGAEDQPYFPKTEVSISGTDCLAETFSNFGEFLEGTLPNEEVAAFWDCALVAVNSIEKYMVGSTASGDYKSTDVRWFAGKYFLKSDQPDGVVINDVLLDEMMEVKRLFLGGSRVILTRDEIAATRQIIREFKEMSLQINPHIRVLFYDTDDKASQTRVGRAISDLSSVVLRFGQLLAQRGNSYEFARLIRLIDEIDKLVDGENKEIPNWSKFVPALQKIKALLLDSREDVVEYDEWSSLAKFLGEGMGLIFRSKYFFSEKSLYGLDTLVEFQLMYRSAKGLFDETFRRRQGRPISEADVMGIVDALESVSLLPGAFSSEDIRQLWGVLADRILSPDSAEIDGFGERELSYLTTNFQSWYKIQQWLLGDPVSEDEDIQEMSDVLSTPWPFRTDSEGRLVFDDNRALVPNIESTSQLNWERAAFRLLIKAYAEDSDRKASLAGLNKAEVERALADIRPIFVQLGVISPDDTNFQNRVFLEASLFVPRANGDDLFDFYEMIEYLHYIFAGIRMGDNFVAALGPDCLVGEDLVDSSCFRTGFREMYADRFANMPFMVSYLSSLSDRGFDQALVRLETAVRAEGPVDEPITTSDIKELGIMLQYIETVMFRFDQDRSGFLDTPESLLAAPLFVHQLSDLIGIGDKKEIRRIFTYMLKYGNPPDPQKPISLIRYLFWRWNEKSWDIKADRGKIISILGSLGELL